METFALCAVCFVIGMFVGILRGKHVAYKESALILERLKTQVEHVGNMVKRTYN